MECTIAVHKKKVDAKAAKTLNFSQLFLVYKQSIGAREGGSFGMHLFVPSILHTTTPLLEHVNVVFRSERQFREILLYDLHHSTHHGSNYSFATNQFFLYNNGPPSTRCGYC